MKAKEVPVKPPKHESLVGAVYVIEQELEW